MWYLDLMRPLLDKLPKSSRNDGELFLKGVLGLAQTIGAAPEKNSPGPEMFFYLGLIEKSFLKFENATPGSIDLTTFSRHIMGLTLLYLKSSQDSFAIWNEDFIGSDFDKIKVFLELNKEPKKKEVLCLNQFESDVYAGLDHKVDIDLAHLRSIFKVNSTLEIAQSFSKACEGLSKEEASEGFNKLREDSDMAIILDSLFSFQAELNTVLESADKALNNTADKLGSTSTLPRLSIFKSFTEADVISAEPNDKLHLS